MAMKKVKRTKGTKTAKTPPKSSTKAGKKEVKGNSKEKPEAKEIKITAKKTKVVSSKPVAKRPSAVKATKAPSTTGKSGIMKATLKKQLIQKREDIVKEAKFEIGKYVKGETRHLVETALDDGDWSVIDLSEDINLRRLETHRGTLLRIDEALGKLKDGTYGICEDCGEKINAERLKVMPFAIYCRDCQERREELEKVEREEIT